MYREKGEWWEFEMFLFFVIVAGTEDLVHYSFFKSRGAQWEYGTQEF